MSTSLISIGGDQRTLEDADPQWITQEIQGRREDGQDVCVVIRVQTDDLNITLSTPSCAGGGGGGRLPTSRERAVLELWKESGLDQTAFSPGNVVAFLRRLRKFI